MTIVSTATPTVHQTIALSADVTPDVQAGLTALAALLCVSGYGLHARGRILDHVAREETLAGLVESGLIEPADHADAEAVYVAGMLAVPAESAEWGSPFGGESPDVALDDCWSPNDTISLDVDDLVDDVPDAPDWYLTQRPGYAAKLAAAGIILTPSTSPLPAICGGSDDIPPPYEPSLDDWADYEAHCRTADYLDGFNSVRPD